jgi:hypothetical protein
MSRSEPKFLLDIERGNDVPLVVSRWGFKRIEINGRAYLTPYTEEEARAELKKLNIEDRGAYDCYTEVMWGACHVYGGCKVCKSVSTSAGWICICTD